MALILISISRVSVGVDVDLIESYKAKFTGKGIFVERIQGQVHLEG